MRTGVEGGASRKARRELSYGMEGAMKPSVELTIDYGTPSDPADNFMRMITILIQASHVPSSRVFSASGGQRTRTAAQQRVEGEECYHFRVRRLNLLFDNQVGNFQIRMLRLLSAAWQ